VGSINFFTGIFGLENIACDEYQSKSTLIEDNGIPQIVTIYRHLDTVNETQPFTTSIERVEIEQIPGLDLYNKNCLGGNLDSLNYDLSDIYFYNEKLFLANANFDTTSIQIYTQDLEGNFDLDPIEVELPEKPLTVRSYEFAYLVGLDNDAGCYISLLESDGNDEGKFTIAEGFTIRDIHFNQEQELLLLSTGYGGVLVYDWNGISMPISRAMIASGYAYSALLYNENKIIIGTKNGIEIYEID
jgi:hypothetical protein